METNTVRIHEKDNVIIATTDISKGKPVIEDGKELFAAVDDIPAGYKVAVSPIACDEEVFRYGEPIVKATRAIEPGESVHVHNTEPTIKGFGE